MSERSLTLQMKLGSSWYDAASLSFDRSLASVTVTYAVEHVFPDDDRGETWPLWMRALSMRWEPELAPLRCSPWPALLDDIMPGGAARRWWARHLGLQQKTQAECNLEMLRLATIAPVGHLRVKEAADRLSPPPPEPHLFPLESVLEREHDFLEHAQLQGVSVGGATGAGGEAPKLLLRVRDGDAVWIDAHQRHSLQDAHVLVKFPRRTRHRPGGYAHATATDALVLRSEAAYYRALDALGVATIDVSRMQLRENTAGQPSLWMPRFDTRWDGTQELRLGLESLYALTNAPAGSRGDHQRYLNTLHRCLIEGRFLASLDESTPHTRGPRSEELVIEYIRRDLLNVVFGNTDNHGRNTAILKSPEEVWLAPVYDFAPMAIDPDGVVRTTRWNSDLENLHGIHWRAICQAQKHLADPEAVWHGLRRMGTALRDLDERLEALGLPLEALDAPMLKLRRVNARLRQWDLIEEGATP